VATDLTQTAVDLTRKYLDAQGLQAVVRQANAEELPFEAESFDLVVASGVIHHTPGVRAAAAEIARVLKPGGAALLSVYYRNALLQPYSFWLTRRAIRLFSIQSRAFGRSGSVDDFTRRYDGDQNPLGRSYSKGQLLRLFHELQLQRFEVHYFPTRFLRSPAPAAPSTEFSTGGWGRCCMPSFGRRVLQSSPRSRAPIRLKWNAFLPSPPAEGTGRGSHE
jgi:SAM-dependent methyltransferase